MFDPRDSDQDLADDIGFGLWRHGRLKVPIEACRLIGAAVVAHLKLAGWRLHRKMPDPPHSAGERLQTRRSEPRFQRFEILVSFDSSDVAAETSPALRVIDLRRAR